MFGFGCLDLAQVRAEEIGNRVVACSAGQVRCCATISKEDLGTHLLMFCI